MEPVAGFPDPLGPHLDPAHSREHHHGAVGDREAADHFAEEIEIPGGIQQVQLGVHPLGVADAERDGVFAIDFVRGGIGEGTAFLDRPMAAAGTGHEREGVHQGRLATRAVAHERHVPDGLRPVNLHPASLGSGAPDSRPRIGECQMGSGRGRAGSDPGVTPAK